MTTISGCVKYIHNAQQYDFSAHDEAYLTYEGKIQFTILACQ